MSDLAELMVQQYLTCGGRAFVCPQFGLTEQPGKPDWANVDFIELDFPASQCVIVEVSTAANFAPLRKRVTDRKQAWFEMARARLQRDGIRPCEGDWQMLFLGVVRFANLARARRFFVDMSDVKFIALEHIGFSYSYWDDRQKSLWDDPLTRLDKPGASARS